MLGRAVNNSWKVIDLDRLFLDVVRALTGRADVVLKFETPPSRGAIGSMAVGLDGIPVIWLDPSLDLAALVTLLAHECAHVVLHARSIPRSTVTTAGAGSYTNQARLDRDAVYLAEEKEAHDLQDRWLDHAAANSWRVVDQDYTLAGFHPAIYKLLVLKGLGK